MRSQVDVMLKIMENWESYQELSKRDKEFIEWQLNFIGDTAVIEYKHKINELCNELLVTKKNK
jgi:hypothetical protein